ncbi:hypothetical protein ASE73_15685 [Sphingomonas sp. Leaf24]|uniref:HlyD family type I secretion periplasmic adaptor subunit n=1 Tax=unclassified Sphingomonas TaxID=196159 RepID=UPI0006F79161|nr:MULTISPECIES: HlyD family type I secretion periplasmic adaptor subunit [unclassified Sphingomonas]KQM21489.1 hypothetical protein ASE50_13915 [Sphingomonas sp. Leaf5]KQM93605.1 hypothetical protein ASE73_15685 [Sphingomonas sp. Leaf24]
MATVTDAGGFAARLKRSWNPYDPSRLAERGLEPVAVEESTVRRRGTWLIVTAVGAFFVWSITAPIDAGSNMVGTVTVAGYRKAVQHPTGGVVQKVLVSEGDKVRQGQVLLRINPLETEATLTNLRQEYINTLVSVSRAKAELLGRGIVWDPELAALERESPNEVAEAKMLQQRFFTTRRQQYAEQARGLSAQIAGLSGAVASHRVQLGTLSEELHSVETLAKDGFVPKAQYNTTLRNKVDQEAALQTAQADVGKIRAQMAETQSQFQSEVAKELTEFQKNREALATKLSAARFNQSLSEIRAPVAGTIVNLKVFTEGGVINGGEVLMEVVPSDGALIVETKVPPASIDKVHVGMPADVRFTSFNATITPVVHGTVKSVGIDKLKAKPGEEVRENEDYYLAQVEIGPDALKELGDNQLRPGMPADVIAKRGERTFMSWLLKPLADKFARAFKD